MVAAGGCPHLADVETEAQRSGLIETAALGLELGHLAHDCLYPEPPRSREDKEALLLGPTRSPGRDPGGFHESGSPSPIPQGTTALRAVMVLKHTVFVSSLLRL